MADFLMRSLMFVPGNNDHFLEKAAASEADILLLDVEDSVPGVSNKQIARDNIVKYAQDGLFKQPLFPRVNDRESGELLKDLLQLTIPEVAGFMYPKSHTGKDIYFIDKLLEAIEAEKHIPRGTFKLIPLIETTSAVLHAEEICKASERVIAIAFGCEDYVTDLHGIHDTTEESIFTARSLIAMAARTANVIPIDTVHINVKDLDDLEKNLQIGKRLGFEGMLVLNPKELPLVHQYYSPTADEYNFARTMIEAANAAKATDKGVTVIGKMFVGPPMVKQARSIVEKYEKILQG